jgi:hypothetical protein
MKRLVLLLGTLGLVIGAFAAGRSSAMADEGVTLMIHHKVASFDKWKPGFDGHEGTRRKFGWTAHTVLTGVGDPNDVFIIGKVKSAAAAKEFGAQPELKEVMKKAGVVGAPEISLLKVAEQKTY